MADRPQAGGGCGLLIGTQRGPTTLNSPVITMKHLLNLAALSIAAASFAAPLSSAMAADAPAKLVNGARVDAKGMTVYTYQADQKPGDRGGDNFKDVWHIIEE